MTTAWNRATRYLVLIVVLGFLLWLLISIRALLSPLLVAALLAYVLNPAVTLIKRRTRLPHNWSVTVIYLLFLAVLAATLVLVLPVLINQIDRLSAELRSVRAQLGEAWAEPVSIAGLQVPLQELLIEFDELSYELLRPGRIFRVLQIATSNLVWVLVILVTAYYLLRDGDHLTEWSINLAPEAYRPDVRRLLQEIRLIWQAYLRGQLALMVTVGVLTGLVSAAAGLRGAAALGLLAGALDLIPSLGPTAALVVAAAVAWFDGSSYLPLPQIWFTGLVVVLYNLVQLAENVWLQPHIMGRALRLNSGLVFVAVVGALTMAGALVALIIVPVLGSAGIIGRYLHRRMLGLPPWSEEAAGVPDQAAASCQLSPIEPHEPLA